MPLKQGYTTDGRGYYSWGLHGQKYTYSPGDISARKRAKTMAMKGSGMTGGVQRAARLAQRHPRQKTYLKK